MYKKVCIYSFKGKIKYINSKYFRKPSFCSYNVYNEGISPNTFLDSALNEENVHLSFENVDEFIKTIIKKV